MTKLRFITGLAVLACLFVLLGGACAADIQPLAMSTAAIGGADLNQYSPGVYGGTGVYNLGLLVRLWGKVTYLDSGNKYFYIDDGSKRADGSGRLGVRVSYDKLDIGNTFTPPGVNSYVAITGISSTWVNASQQVQPMLRTRRDLDMQTIIP